MTIKTMKSFIRTSTSVGLTLFLLAGCAVGPDYKRPDVDIPSAWRSEYQAAASAADTAWWEQFQDPVLNELIITALNENRDLRIAAARVSEYAGRLQIARSNYFPQLGYQASGLSESRGLFRVNPFPQGQGRQTIYEVDGTVNWEIDVWGKLRRASEAARADLLAARETRQAVILTLVSDVASSYIRLLALDKLLATANETVAARKDFLDLFERKRAGGQISAMELAQVRSAYEQAAESVPDIERRIVMEEDALSVLLGKNPGAIRRGKTLDTLALPEIPQGMPSDLLLRRPDIRIAEQELIAANARIGVARAQYFPEISLTGLFGAASQSLSDLFRQSSQFWFAGGRAAGEIFTGGRVSGGVQVAEAQQQQLVQAYLGTIQTAFKEVNDSLVTVRKIRELLDVQGRHADALKEYASTARGRYDAKYASYIDVLDADRNLFNTRMSTVQTRSDLMLALVSIYKSMGGGWVSEADKRITAPDRKKEQAKTAKHDTTGTPEGKP